MAWRNISAYEATWLTQSFEHPRWRRILITGLVTIYVARMLYTLFAWFGATGAKRLKDQASKSAILVLPFFLVPIFSWIHPLPFFAAMDRTGNFDVFDATALTLYAVGTVFHFGADLQKWRYRLDPANKGNLLQRGFWGMSRHPNYFGDFIIYLSFALISVWPWEVISPVTNFLQYFFDAIPKNEKEAQTRYGETWKVYVDTTPTFLPLRFYRKSF
ncbi:DUF1295 domain-containing protein [Microbulbifer sp. 2304DJ12-6]|uniref:DUF1295 domain-containing protein n=1 Tax=Microbulbifer sp. 2304DJ12-6 TaxID=3233340 RepID=UPI0039AF1C77